MLRRLILLSCVTLVLSLPALADEPVFRLRVGEFTPDGESSFWNDKAEIFEGSAGDLKDTSYGLDWNYPITRGLGILTAGSYFVGQTERIPLDDAPFSGTHDTELRLISLNVLLTYMAPADWRVRPWVGVGGGVNSWRLQETGDIWDGGSRATDGKLSEDDRTFGFTAAIGVDFWIQRNWGLSLDLRQYWAEADPSKAFADRGKIDLSGQEYALGFVWIF